MDSNQLRKGITVYLPVYALGALLFLGDGHLLEDHGGNIWVAGWTASKSTLCFIGKGGTQCHGKDSVLGSAVGGLYEDREGRTRPDVGQSCAEGCAGTKLGEPAGRGERHTEGRLELD